MDAERWARVQEVFHQVADLTGEERAGALRMACGSDEALRREVEALLAQDAAPAATVVDRSLGEVAHAVLQTDAELPAMMFGPYRATALVGEGGMGVVYQGQRDDIGGVAAIKVLRDAALSPARRERFMAEQRVLAQLNHPSIARLYDAGTLAAGTPWIAMEFVDGIPLDQYCRSRHLTLAQRLALVRNTCRAVEHAHQHLVVHRDLKPSNVLVTPGGEVKLLDFGIAKQLGAGDAAAAATRTGLRLMTPAYAAPEQVRGTSVSVHTDVYALGVMVYELLTGRVPFDVGAVSASEAERLVLEVDPPRPSSVGSVEGLEVPAAAWPDLDVLCLTALQKEPARRYPSVAALAGDIDHFLAGQPLDARADSFGYRASKFVRRHARAVLGSAAAVVLILAGATFYTARLAAARDLAVAEGLRAQRIQRFMTALFQGGDEAAGPADSLRVVTLLEQGMLEARGLDREPAVQAALYQTLGNIYRQLGLLERADSLLQMALTGWGALGMDTDRARTLVEVGDLRVDQARYAAADSVLTDAALAMRASAATTDADRLNLQVTRARVLTERGAHDSALAVLDTAVAIAASNMPDTPEHLGALTELANARFYAGQYDAADSVNRIVLDMTRRIHGARHPLVAEDLMNLGATEQERGNYKEAEAYFREALALTTSFYGPEHPRTAGNLIYVGRALLLQNRYPEARAALTRALAIRERVFGEYHPSVANTLNELGSLGIREEQYAAAESTFRRVLKIYRQTYPDRNFRVGVGLGNLGDTYLYRRQYDRAEPLYREALAHYLASQGPDHLNTGIGYIKLGRALMRAGRFREGEVETLRGYGIVGKVASPTISFLQAARLDLSIIYDSLGKPELAAKYRAEREQNK